MSLKAEMNRILKDCRKAGWSVERTGGRHWKCKPPNGGGIVFAASTPSDYRSLANTKAELRRAERAGSCAL